MTYASRLSGRGHRKSRYCSSDAMSMSRARRRSGVSLIGTTAARSNARAIICFESIFTPSAPAGSERANGTRRQVAECAQFALNAISDCRIPFQANASPALTSVCLRHSATSFAVGRLQATARGPVLSPPSMAGPHPLNGKRRASTRRLLCRLREPLRRPQQGRARISCLDRGSACQPQRRDQCVSSPLRHNPLRGANP